MVMCIKRMYIARSMKSSPWPQGGTWCAKGKRDPLVKDMKLSPVYTFVKYTMSSPCLRGGTQCQGGDRSKERRHKCRGACQCDDD